MKKNIYMLLLLIFMPLLAQNEEPDARTLLAYLLTHTLQESQLLHCTPQSYSVPTIIANITGTATYALNAQSAVTSTSVQFATNTIFSVTAQYAPEQSADVPNTLVLRDSTGSFAATTITANLTGTATYALNAGNALTSTSATYAINANRSVTSTSAAFATNALITVSALYILNAGSSADTPNTLVLRNSNGNFTATTITANLTGTAAYALNATSALTCTNALYALNANSSVTSTSAVYATNALFSVTATYLAGATVADIPNTLALRDGNGSFAATTMTLAGNAQLQGPNSNTITLQAPASGTYSLVLPTSVGTGGQLLTTAGTNPDQLTWTTISAVVSSTISLFGDVIGSSTASVISRVCGVAACNLAQTYSTVLTATSCGIALALVLRDSTGSFAATTVTLTGNSLINYSSVGGCDTGSGVVFAPTNQNTLIGLSAGANNLLTGGQNSALGNAALAANSTGTSNSAFGIQALSANTTGINNSAFGAYALSGANASNNVAVGASTGANVTTGTGLVLLGYKAGSALTTATNVTVIGSGIAGINANNTCYIGSIRGATLTGSNAVPVLVDRNNQLGTLFNNSDTLLGYQALNMTPANNNNIAIGYQAMANGSQGARNIAIGYGALYQNSNNSDNIVIGTLISGQNTSQCVAIGSGTLNADSGGCILIGSPTEAGDVSIAIGIGAKTNLSGECIVIGNNSAAIGGNSVLIGNNITAPYSGTFIAHGADTVVSGGLPLLVTSSGLLGTNSSSKRYKENITDLGELSKNLYQLRLVQFNYLSDREKYFEVGLIAEEVHEIMPEIVVYKNGQPDGVRYHILPIMMISEVQAHQKMILELEQKNRELEKDLYDLLASITKTDK